MGGETGCGSWRWHSTVKWCTTEPVKKELIQLLLSDTLEQLIGGSAVMNLPATWETWVPSLDWEDPLEEGMTTHSSILAWNIPMDRGAWWLQSMGLQRVRHDWVHKTLSRSRAVIVMVTKSKNWDHKRHIGNILSWTPRNRRVQKGSIFFFLLNTHLQKDYCYLRVTSCFPPILFPYSSLPACSCLNLPHHTHISNTKYMWK